MQSTGGIEPAGSPVSLRAIRNTCRTMLAGLPLGAALVFDQEFRVRLAEGEGFAHGKPDDIVGSLLPEVVPADVWRQLEGPYKRALESKTTTFDVAVGGRMFSVRVLPLALPGETPGALAISHEITEQRRLEAVIDLQESAARASDELLGAAFDRAPIGMTVVAPKGQVLRVNEAYCRMVGYERDELVGSPYRDLTHPDDMAEDRAFWASVAAGNGDILEREKRFVRRDGATRWAHVRAEVIRDEAGQPLYAVSHVQDVSARHAAQDQLHDSERTMRSIIDNTPALVYVKGRDYRYQLVNREFELAYSVRGDWIIGRTDEGLLPDEVREEVHAKDRLVLEGGESMQEEETVLRGGQERVFLNVRFPLLDDHAEIQGVCCMSTDVTDRRREESARRERLQCSEQIHSALAQDRFLLHGQPIVDLASMRVEQSELLIRMMKARDAEDLLPPGAFLPAAERFDLIQAVDEWVVGRAVELAANGHVVNVNLSAKTISDPAQVDRIEQEIVASGAPPENLIFEITETAVAENLDAARDFALRLRKLGCAFALDDFGVGHGTFTYLRHLAVDYLKIDIQFVQDLLSDDLGRQVVQAIIGVAKQFGIKTIAEGVEDQATLEELRRLGVDYAQGYWIGRPMPLPDLWELPTHLKGELNAARP